MNTRTHSTSFLAFTTVTALAATSAAQGAGGPVCPPGCVPARVHASTVHRARAARTPAPFVTAPAPVAEAPAITPPAPVADVAPGAAPVATIPSPQPPMPARPFRGGGPVPTWRPTYTLGLEGGVSAMEEGAFNFDGGTGHATWAGPAWGARVGVDFMPWIGLEARYTGMYNGGRAAVVGDGAGLVTNSGALAVRLIAPLPHVQPYVFGGAGVYGTSVIGNDPARQASTFTNSVSFGIPAGVGFDVPVNRTYSFGGEATYHHLFGESFSSREAIAGADLVTGTAVFRVHL